MSKTIKRYKPAAALCFARDARSVVSTFNEADRSFEVVVATDSPVKRFDFFEFHRFDETLKIDESAVRLDRLNDNAPLLDSHRTDSLEAVIGSVIPGSIRFEPGKLIARVRLASTESVSDIASKVRDGHICEVSVGYQIHCFERIEHEDADCEMHAIDWESYEISLVPIPADPAATIRKGDTPMPLNPEEISDGDPAPNNAVTVKRILEVCSRSASNDVPFAQAVVDRHEREPLNEADLQEIIAQRISQNRPNGAIRAERSGRTENMDRHGETTLAGRIEAALAARIGGTEPPEASRDLMGLSLIGLARELLEESGTPARRMSDAEVFKRSVGMQTTSDFANVLENALGKVLAQGYEAHDSELKRIARVRDVNDFREIKHVGIDGSGQLEQVGEHGEFKHGAFSELPGQSYALDTYGKIFALSRQAMINDDLGAFADLVPHFVSAAGELRATLLSSLISSNVTMGDGKSLFHADHANLAGSGGAITVDTLSAGRLAMRKQTTVDGLTKIRVVPKFLVVPPERETEGEQVLAALSSTAVDEVNPFSGKLELVVEPYLPASAWYIFAAKEQAPVLEYARLRGQPEVFTETRIGWGVDGMEIKARVDIGAGAVDYRGAYKNPGS